MEFRNGIRLGAKYWFTWGVEPRQMVTTCRYDKQAKEFVFTGYAFTWEVSKYGFKKIKF